MRVRRVFISVRVRGVKVVPVLINMGRVLLQMDSWEKLKEGAKSHLWHRELLGAAVYQAMQGPFRLAAQEMQSIASISERVSPPPDAASRL